MSRRLLALAVASAAAPGVLAALPAASAATHARPEAVPVICGRSFNPYQAGAAVARSCGEEVYPLAQVKPLPGGGKAYVYHVNGTKVTTPVPSAGFRPLTASNARLREYGFPIRPARGAARAQWAYAMRHINHHWATPPSFMVVDPHAHNGDLSGSPAASGQSLIGSWVGNVADNGFFTNASGNWYEPTIYSSQCTDPAESLWAGIGGLGAGTALDQAGTTWGLSQFAPHQAWWETIPGNGMTAGSISATPGEQFGSLVTLVSGGVDFFLENYYTGAVDPVDVSVTSTDAASAEVIVEAPRIAPNTNTYLANYKSFQVYDASVSTDGGLQFTGIGALAHVDAQIEDTTGYIEGWPGATSNAGQTWTDNQRRCY